MRKTAVGLVAFVAVLFVAARGVVVPPLPAAYQPVVSALVVVVGVVFLLVGFAAGAYWVWDWTCRVREAEDAVKRLENDLREALGAKAGESQRLRDAAQVMRGELEARGAAQKPLVQDVVSPRSVDDAVKRLENDLREALGAKAGESQRLRDAAQGRGMAARGFTAVTDHRGRVVRYVKTEPPSC